VSWTRWKRILLVGVATAVVVGMIPVGGQATPRATSTFVSARVPVLGHGRALAAARSITPAGHPTAPTTVSPNANPWHQLGTIPGAVVHDISFPTLKIGYAAAELGQVWKTTDGGKTWTNIMNVGFPYYWYGVGALTANDVVISGFNDQNFTGILRWTHDGGSTWSSDLVITDDGWSNRVRFEDRDHAIVNSIVSLNSANEAQYTTNGGQNASDWTTVTPDPNGGWFGADLPILPDGTAYLSGITDCVSHDEGPTWSCRPSVDSVFDGAIAWLQGRNGRKLHGWVGGGEISPNVEGWVHVTNDGGKTWSGRTLDSPWPIRTLDFLNPSIGWAAGGNVYSGVGGMYYSSDGGQTWSLDADTGAEMQSCAQLRQGSKVQVWCAGFNGSFSGVVYGLRMSSPSGTNLETKAGPPANHQRPSARRVGRRFIRGR
jgi:photosystem II stability/assembly factor-like uncharacterized protein